MKALLELKDCKRSIELYLRALWNKGFSLQFSKNDNTVLYSYLAEHQIYLPEHVLINSRHSNYYRAAATHISAHIKYSQQAFEVKELNLLQRSIIDLIEDLRVELLAIEKFPGLRKIWLEFHVMQQVSPDSALNLVKRLSRSVLDPTYHDPHQWVIKGKKLIQKNLHRLKDQSLSLELGLSLANDLGQMRLPLNSGRYENALLYRDDNRHLWQDIAEHTQQAEVSGHTEEVVIQQKKLLETTEGKQIELANNEYSRGQGLHINYKENASFEYCQLSHSKIISTIIYPEWDYRLKLLKQNWCTLIERQAVAGSDEKIDEIFLLHQNTLNRLRHIAKRLQVEKQQRIRKIQEGDDIDFDPMINAMVAMRMGQDPDTRVFVRNEYRQSKSLAISILLDLSESTNQMTGDVSITQMLRDAVLLLGETLTIADEQFSISGFSSNGRHEINYLNFKKFSESFNASKTRLADIQGEYSTRLGTAIRHSAQSLAQQNARKKLLLVIT
ncbi:MAG: hypothetical protein OEW97_07660, partial [Gammaproteobacteria bacterium]|nr:hypothetical protein [Gammaproteobacteria bacterium]